MQMIAQGILISHFIAKVVVFISTLCYLPFKVIDFLAILLS